MVETRPNSRFFSELFLRGMQQLGGEHVSELYVAAQPGPFSSEIEGSRILKDSSRLGGWRWIMFRACVVLGILIALNPSLQAQAVTTLYKFCTQVGSGGVCADGFQPRTPLVQGSDGNFYGTTYLGGGGQLSGSSVPTGNAGTVFKISPTGTFAVLYDFCSQTNCSDGGEPQAALFQGSDGNFYGTTDFGGNSNALAGTAFKITPSGTYTTLYTFCSQNTPSRACLDGGEPVGAFTQGTDGNFYGTSPAYGSDVYGEGYGAAAGTVFKMTSSGTLTTIYNFCSQPSCTDGQAPSSQLVQGSDGNFYGLTSCGGANQPPSYVNYFGCLGGGTFFKITPGGTLTTLYSFCAENSPTINCTDGYLPQRLLILGSDGNFYGETYCGGANTNPNPASNECLGTGTVFKISPSGTLTTLYSFCALANCEDGTGPTGLIQDSNGNFFIATANGGNCR